MRGSAERRPTGEKRSERLVGRDSVEPRSARGKEENRCLDMNFIFGSAERRPTEKNRPRLPARARNRFVFADTPAGRNCYLL